MKNAKIEVFKAGKYGESPSRQWSEEETKELVENYDPKYRNAPIILGHNDWEAEKPAYGWAKSFHINEKGIVIANIEYNDALQDMIEKKMYTRVSIEATKKIEVQDKSSDKKGAYILAIALLGGSQPAVSGLAPVHFKIEEKDKIESFEMEIDDMDENSEVNIEKPNGAVENFSDTIVDEIDSRTGNKESILIKKELEELKKDKVAFKLEQDKDKKDREKFEAEKESFRIEKLTADVEKFMDDNSKRISPVSADSIKEFMLSLTEELLQNFKDIISAMPENEVFERMENLDPDEVDDSQELSTDEKFHLQAIEDLKTARK